MPNKPETAEASTRIPVIVMGLGSIGQSIARAALLSEEVQLVGAVDSTPKLVGTDLGALLGFKSEMFSISDDLKGAAGAHKGGVVLHATGSRLGVVCGEILEAVRFGWSVVSTCEELAFPYFRNEEMAEKIEAAAQKAAVSVVGMGVNPGFVFDRLVATLGQTCGPVRHVKAVRVVDARSRRAALQRKIGAGLTEDEFFKLVDRDQLGHIGLVESAALCALGLGLDCDDFEEEISPVIAEEDIDGAFPVKAGKVAGISQTAIALSDEQERVRLELTIAVGVENPRDEIEIEADTKVVMRIEGGLAGDSVTANVVVNAAPRVKAAQSGLLTVLELPAGR